MGGEPAVVAVTLTQALAALKAARKIRSVWLPGMADVEEQRVLCSEHADGLVFVDVGNRRGWFPPSALEAPDLTDPATVGCLLALLREAHEDSGVWVGPSHPEAWVVFVRGESGWEESGAFGETDGEALAAALIALAEQP